MQRENHCLACIWRLHWLSKTTTLPSILMVSILLLKFFPWKYFWYTYLVHILQIYGHIWSSVFEITDPEFLFNFIVYSVLFCSSAILDLKAGHTINIVYPFISVLCYFDWLLHGESCPCLDVVHLSCAWSSSPACTWHCSLHYLFLQATPLFPRGVTIVC